MNQFLQTLSNTPELIEFEDTIGIIEKYYDFSPCCFTNGSLVNQEGQNSGSCKIFAFGKLHGIGEDAILHCFGRYYREDVKQNPTGTDHQNIRNFMENGWKGIWFERIPLQPKATVKQ
ncbi:HopJ type III effector protein [Enterovibrio sp. ZSDZ35]|uniref:HopJ type III effector protein n=1 Tax=Enterovibrio qingdaonensis TaxID=2899818 RepID=A0ABT5QLH6_9GAMM|nr:HopJ type III effector protein [Enterovibrio sp. ZSDZ35]MDD1781832.1 HopJ type III effector protein [Enterovibrio sp. ZSDZ35]